MSKEPLVTVHPKRAAARDSTTPQAPGAALARVRQYQNSRKEGSGDARGRSQPQVGMDLAWDTASSGQLLDYQPEVHGRLVSYSQRTRPIDAMAFVERARGRERFFWRDGQSGITLAGLGTAAHLMGWGEARFRAIERQAQALFQRAVVLGENTTLAAPRLFGGFAFGEDFVPDVAWTGFYPAHFILPHYQLQSDGHETWLTINALVPPEENPWHSRAQLREALETFEASLSSAGSGPRRALPTPLETKYPMSAEQWATAIGQAGDRFRTTPLQKVVLSRVCEVNLSLPPDLEAALAYLGRGYGDCYSFLFEPSPQHAFVGATPELLVSVRGQALATMALAGSTQRGATREEDDELATKLRGSPKDLHEHVLVVNSLVRRLETLVDCLHVPSAPSILQLDNIQHLLTPVQGTLKRATGILPLVELLHPTPALGGSPRDLALAFIGEAEPVPRGWYAAPVGWIDHRLEGVFAVAIRSAVAQQRRVWLYAGAGIVPDSQAEREWLETSWKFRPMLEALAAGTGSSCQLP